MKPWREVITPHPDVLEGTFQQSEFAADITAVHSGQASKEYQDAAAFYERTFITEGMQLLLTSVAKRLRGEGGDPVIQLQTAFGGGKTHTMLAVYHLATHAGALSDLSGLSSILDAAKISGLPKARVAVLDGTAHAPGQAWKRGKQEIKTLWGELAWQLGGEASFALVKAADVNGTSPGKDVLKELLEQNSPCVVLIDELVAYIRQFNGSDKISGGSYDTNLSFVQALTEATKLVDNAIVLASLPESEIEAGSAQGVTALKAMAKTFGRVQALWKPVESAEAFEIVRRRLFETVKDESVRDAVCKAYVDTYIAQGVKLPSETQESQYQERLLQSYPIHPEIFDRLYEDWATIDGFQRTRGVLKLMAKVVYRLWKDQNHDSLILPSSLPLYDGESRNELLYHLPAGWDPVIEGDIDGERAETTEMENHEPRFGAVQAARRVARTLFLGTAPSSIQMRPNTARGLSQKRVLLGCLQPEQSSSLYADALGRLRDTLHYLNTSTEGGPESVRYWFDTRANLRREMEERKQRFDDQRDLKPKIAEVVRSLCGSISVFDGLHVFTTHGDVPDDRNLRLVVLTPEQFYCKSEPKLSNEAVLECLQKNGNNPRYRGNRLIFLAPDHTTLPRLKESCKTVLAWSSIINDVQNGALNIDREQEKQAKRELKSAEETLPKIARECFRWLLCPYMDTPTDSASTIEAFGLGTSGSSLSAEVERICQENELVISTWSPVHLRNSLLQQFYWKEDKVHVEASTVWEDMTRYLYLPRLRNRSAYEAVVKQGADSEDFFGTALGYSDGKYDGFKFGESQSLLTDELLLIEPKAAKSYLSQITKATDEQRDDQKVPDKNPEDSKDNPVPLEPSKTNNSFHGAIDINATAAKMQLTEVVNEVINQLTSDPQAEIRITLDITAKFPDGANDSIKRAVSENANSLGFKNKSWE